MHFNYYSYYGRWGDLRHIAIASSISYDEFRRTWEKYARRIRRRKGWDADDILNAIKADMEANKLYRGSVIFRIVCNHLPSSPKEVAKL